MPIQPLSSENVLLWISYQLFLFPFKNVCLNCFHKNAELDFPTMLIFNFTKLPCTPFFRNVLVILWVDEKPNMTSACPGGEGDLVPFQFLTATFSFVSRISFSSNFRTVCEPFSCVLVSLRRCVLRVSGRKSDSNVYDFNRVSIPGASYCLLDSQSSRASNENSRSLPPVSASSLSFERTRCLGGLRGPRFVYLYLSLNSSSASLGYIPYQGVLIKSACR